jgi:branched-chain amino acid transport system ATP-binding protein
MFDIYPAASTKSIFYFFVCPWHSTKRQTINVCQPKGEQIDDAGRTYVPARLTEGIVRRRGDCSGDGKSTLIKCLMGMVEPSAGTVTLETDDVEKINLIGKSPQEIVELGIALVPEGRRLFPRLTVEENLMLGAHRQMARQDIEANLAFSFEAFPVLAERRRQLAGSMSGGEQQMLALARALMSEPRILLVDEPSVGLAPILVSRMIAKIKELKEQRNPTVLTAKQNFNQAIKIADRGYIIVHGEIAFAADSATELAENDMVKQYYLGA